MLDHVTRESWIIKEKQGFYYKQGVVVHFTLALFETDTLDITICYEITLEKCICVGRTIVSTVPPSDKKKISCKHERLGEVMLVIDPFFAGIHRV